jgi:hypothetical protein
LSGRTWAVTKKFVLNYCNVNELEVDEFTILDANERVVEMDEVLNEDTYKFQINTHSLFSEIQAIEGVSYDNIIVFRNSFAFVGSGC